jgi:hypothetical protein
VLQKKLFGLAQCCLLAQTRWFYRSRAGSNRKAVNAQCHRLLDASGFEINALGRFLNKHFLRTIPTTCKACR